MTLKYLLDTTTVSAPIARRPSRRVVSLLEQRGLQCAIGAPVWHELVYGCNRLAAGQRRAAIEEYLHAVVKRSFPILPYDEVAAHWQGRERARLEKKGKMPPFVDGQIAAIACTQDLTLVTSNAKDFAWFEGLDVIDWSR